MATGTAPLTPAVLPGPMSSNLSGAALPVPTSAAHTLAPTIAAAARTLVIQSPLLLNRSGQAAPEHDLAWFERIHVLPRTVNLGAVLSDQEVEVEVWNAYRVLAHRLSAITVEGPSGVEVDEAADPPTHFPATESLLYHVRALAQGDPRIDNLVTWVFEGLDSLGTGLELVGFRVLPWPFEVNMGEPTTERYGYLTNVMVGDEGSEQRVGLRSVAKGAIAYSCLLDEERDAQHANALLYGGQARAWGVPLWHYRNPLTLAATLGQLEIRVDTSYVPYHVGGLVMLWRNPYLWEVQVIDQVLSDRLVVTQVLQRSWPLNETVVMPMVIGNLSQQETMTWLTVRQGETRLSFNVEGFFA